MQLFCPRPLRLGLPCSPFAPENNSQGILNCAIAVPQQNRNTAVEDLERSMGALDGSLPDFYSGDRGRGTAEMNSDVVTGDPAVGPGISPARLCVHRYGRGPLRSVGPVLSSSA